MPYFDPATAESEEQHYLKIAADYVQKYAPVPNPLPTPDTYSPRAARAERLVMNYLEQTSGGVVSGQSLSGVGSFSYSAEALKAIRSIISGAMGDYYQGGSLRRVAIVSSFPR